MACEEMSVEKAKKEEEELGASIEWINKMVNSRIPGPSRQGIDNPPPKRILSDLIILRDRFEERRSKITRRLNDMTITIE